MIKRMYNCVYFIFYGTNIDTPRSKFNVVVSHFFVLFFILYFFYYLISIILCFFNIEFDIFISSDYLLSMFISGIILFFMIKFFVKSWLS